MITIIVMKIILTIITIVVVFCKLKNSKKNIPDKRNAVFITGCDSGIGYSLAIYCQKLGFTVFAACLSDDSQGYLQLKELENTYLIQMDIRNLDSLHTAFISVEKILADNPDLKLATLINNAGSMVFGEFAWQTTPQINNQITVNLEGAMNITQIFLTHIRKNKGRIINICSHCAMEAVPGLSVYAATKAGLMAWNNALRLELKKLEVLVISVIPGAFPQTTNIFSKHTQYVKEMKENMSPEEWNFYKDYFLEYHNYLGFIQSPTKCKAIEDKYFYRMFNEALLSFQPKSHYSNSPLRYSIYHFLFKISPTEIRDYLMMKFANLPEWKS